MVAITIPRPVLAVAASAVGSYLIGEGMWQALEYLAKRAEDSYEKTMGSLQLQFVTYAESVNSKKDFYPSINSRWSKSSVIPLCPHVNVKRGWFSENRRDVYLCSANKQTCIDKRKEILTTQDSFNKTVERLVRIPGNETKWILIALVTGVATALLSTILILPKTASSGMRFGCLVAGGFIGILAAASTTFSRINISSGSNID